MQRKEQAVHAEPLKDQFQAVTFQLTWLPAEAIFSMGYRNILRTSRHLLWLALSLKAKTMAEEKDEKKKKEKIKRGKRRCKMEFAQVQVGKKKFLPGPRLLHLHPLAILCPVLDSARILDTLQSCPSCRPHIRTHIDTHTPTRTHSLSFSFLPRKLFCGKGMAL